ncbi:MAG: hypothetical protein VZR09_03185 [Candidatus Gastranaerophilaceae bacterium]|nr:hypothetical protein [Candidatus Gastranaerophilaceae bacterium]
MARVESISTQDRNPYSVFGSISKGVVTGAVLGYVAKNALPLQNSEKNEAYYQGLARVKEDAKLTKGIVIDEIRNLDSRTPAQDVFIKAVDAEKAAGADTNAAKRAFSMHKLIKEAGLDENGMKELRNIIAQVNEKAKTSTKYYVKGYNSAVKNMKRPTIAFLTMGAVAGFFGGLIHNVLTSNKEV